MEKRRVWLSPRALRLHAVILIVVPAFLALCAWQIFAGYAVYMWWRFVHEVAEGSPPAKSTDGPTTTATERASAAPVLDAGTETHAPVRDEERQAAELAAYNEYLAQLAERDKATGR
jgi:hypothetical protein